MNIEQVIWECLVKAVSRFNESGDPHSLLCPRCDKPKTKTDAAAASERAIAHRLAYYLESELRKAGIVGDAGPIVVDCEYNRHLAGAKSLAEEAEDRIKQIVWEARHKELNKKEDGFYVFSVAPDIVVHQRKSDANNLLVVEVKKRSNPETEEYDYLKLELFTKTKEDERGYGYKFGAWIVAEDELPQTDRKLRIAVVFENGKGKKLPA
jgi:hypothetical protein